MVNTLFHDMPDAKVQTLLPELRNLMREQTGLDGEFIVVGDAQDLGKKLNDNQVQFGVFQGFAFAWARDSFPELKPLLIALNRQPVLKASVVINKESKAAALGDLKEKIISIPKGCPEHCRLFLDRELAKLGGEQSSFFAKIVQHGNVEDALDDVLRDKVQAALVDGEGLDAYEQVNPGRFARLKMLLQSDGFPPGLVAYRQGAIDEATLTKFKSGMIKANSSVSGKEQMALWKLSAFEELPKDFEASLADILKKYPAPKGKSVSLR
jgi:ABC-type phosphate/phosphonate transport system substrate-binding protein